MIVQPVVLPAKAKADCPAAFLRRAMETDSGRAVAAVSFAVRFLPGTGPFAVVLFGLSRCSICLATADLVPAADLFVPVDSGLAVAVAAVVAAAAAAAAVVDLFDLSAADLSVVAAGPGSVGSGVLAADLACLVCSFAVALGKWMAVVAVPFCLLTRRSSF